MKGSQFSFFVAAIQSLAARTNLLGSVGPEGVAFGLKGLNSPYLSHQEVQFFPCASHGFLVVTLDEEYGTCLAVPYYPNDSHLDFPLEGGEEEWLEK